MYSVTQFAPQRKAAVPSLTCFAFTEPHAANPCGAGNAIAEAAGRAQNVSLEKAGRGAQQGKKVYF